jgi:hypothetical protein
MRPQTSINLGLESNPDQVGSFEQLGAASTANGAEVFQEMESATRENADVRLHVMERGGEDQSTKIFTSYRGSHTDAAAEIVRRLRGQGYNLFFAGTDLKTKSDILPALDECGWFLVVLSKDYFESQWCLLELAYAHVTGKQISCCVANMFDELGELLSRWKTETESVIDEKGINFLCQQLNAFPMFRLSIS